MRHHLFLCAALVAGTFLFLTASAQAQPELLTNANLDATSISTQLLATPTNWNVAATRSISGPFNDGASSEGFAGGAPTPNTGANDMGLFFKAFQGNPTDGDLTVHFTQDNPATPGLAYFLRGWAGAGAGYSGVAPGSRTQTQMAVEFLNAGNSVIGGTTLDLRAAGLGTAPGVAFGYREYVVSGIAPVGTASVRSRVSMINAFGTSGDQAFVVDDFSLKVPEPSIGLVSLSGVALRNTR